MRLARGVRGSVLSLLRGRGTPTLSVPDHCLMWSAAKRATVSIMTNYAIVMFMNNTVMKTSDNIVLLEGRLRTCVVRKV